MVVKRFYMMIWLAALALAAGMSAAQAEQDACCLYPNLFTERELAYEDRTYQATDEYRHVVTGQAEDYVRCLNCGWGDVIFVAEEISETEEHDFYSGVCEYCGFECWHPDIETVRVADYDFWTGIGNITYEPLDAAHHVRTEMQLEYERCTVCNEKLSEDRPVPEPVTATEYHYFEDGECWECGYSGECVHANVQGYYYTMDETCEPVSDKQHRITGKMYRSRYCFQCDTGLPDELIFENSVAVNDHFFREGVCDSCGYINSCAHSRTIAEQYVASEPVYYLPLNDTFHREIGEIHEQVYCMDCDEKLSDELIMESGVLEKEHRYWDNDYFEEGMAIYCSDCGRLNTCSHENAQILEMSNVVEEPVCTQFDDEYHVVGNLYLYSECPDCDVLISLGMSENETIKAKHDFDLNGLCSICDYIREQWDDEIITATVILPEGLTLIEAEAFLNDAELIAVEIQGDDLIAIGAGAFKGCANLRQITIPDSVTYIAPDAFDGCVGLVIICKSDSYAQQYADENEIAWRESR